MSTSPRSRGAARLAARISAARTKTITAVVATTAAALALSGCATYDVTSPRSAREHAPSGAKVAAGQVDCAELKCVALTFDGGPSETTPPLLDILKKEKVHVTFFMQGKNHVAKYPDVVRRMQAEGHELANHTWSHKVLTKIKPSEIRDELVRVQKPVEKITGRKPTLMRPPQGRTDEKVSKVCRELGLAQVLWSVTAKDYETSDSALITRRVLDQTKRDGVILLHDRHKGTVPAVPGIIAKLKKRGFTIVTVSQLIAPGKTKPGMVYRP